MEAIPTTEDTVTYMNEVDDYKLYWETEDEERPQHYFPGSYHPVKIGDTFSNGRYTIVHKLGHGGYSTVWLARDKSQDQFVALKIMVPEQQSQFELQNYGVEIELLHFTPNNLLLAPPNLSGMTTDELYRKYGEPFRAMTERHDGKPVPRGVPPYIVPEIWFGDRSTELELCNAKVTLTDFGEAWRPALRSRYQLNTPDKYCAPEANFAENENVPLDFPSDVWSLGVGIFELFGGSLFEASPDPDDMLEDMINVLGKPPQRWWDMWEAKEDFFSGGEEWDENGHSPQITHVLLEERLRVWVDRYQKGSMTTEEIEDLHGLIKQILRWEPEDRPTADELLRAPWMKKWGLPALEAMYEARGEKHNIMTEIDSVNRMRKPSVGNGSLTTTSFLTDVFGFSIFEMVACWWDKARGVFNFPGA
ncbi:hypothetical protein N0V92_002602 [Colletotrichum tropicale]|nr:hypothetical protein N0V92_002602 [Colletotrichum tropicale]